MKKILLIASALMLVTGIAQADLLEYEGFDYTGTDLDDQNGGSGWEGAWINDSGSFDGHLSNDDTSLDSAAFPFTPTGDRIEGNGGTALRDMGTNFEMGGEGNVVYVSMLMRKNSTALTAGENVEFSFLGNSNMNNQRLRMGITSTDNFFVASGLQGGESASFGTVAADTTYFLVAKIVSSASGNDQFFLNAYAPGDTVGSSEGTWDANVAGVTGVILDQIRLNIGDGTGMVGSIDEIRIGETWGDVVPEPATTGLLMLGATVTMLIRRSVSR